MVVRRRQAMGRSARRETSWLDIEPVAVNFSAAGSAAITHVMTAAELAKRPFTVVRTHLSLHIGTDQNVGKEEQVGAVGLCVVADQAAAIGVTAVPTPFVDMASDLWFLHKALIADFIFGSTASFNADSGQSVYADSKAMRKVNDDQQIIVVGEAASISDGFNLTILGRMLIKEH